MTNMAPPSYNVATLNIHCIPLYSNIYLRIREFTSQLERSDIEVINIQELYTYDQLILLKKHLASFTFINYSKGIIGPKAGLVTLARIPIRSLRFNRIGFYKGVLSTMLSNKTVLLNIHLIANHNGDWSPDSRFYPRHIEQLNILVRHINYYENQGYNIIATGDFNIAKVSQLYNYLITEGNLNDAFNNFYDPTFRSEFLPKDRIPQCIDYIFTKGSVVTEAPKMIFKDKFATRNGKAIFLSDHLGLSVNIKDVGL